MPMHRSRLRLVALALLCASVWAMAGSARVQALEIHRITYTPRDENWGSWAPDGVSALLSSGESICSNGEWFCGPQNIWSMRFGGDGQLLALDMFAEDAYHPRLSPDGRWAAAMVHNGNDYDIWVWPSGAWGQRVRFQSIDGYQERFPNWSNDSRFIAFDSNRPSQVGTRGYQVFYAPVAEPADPSAAVQVTRVGSNNKHPTWSGDDREIAYVGDAQDRRAISAVNIETGEYRLITPESSQNRHPDWSPNGDWIAFTTDRWDGIGDIAIVRADGSGEPVRISVGMDGHDDFPEWSGDGMRILFCGTAAEFPYRANKEMFVATDLPLGTVPVEPRSLGGLKGRFRSTSQ
jgi:TolB protein